MHSRFTDSEDCDISNILSPLIKFGDPQTAVDRNPPSGDINIIASHISVCKVAKVRECRDKLWKFIGFCMGKIESILR